MRHFRKRFWNKTTIILSIVVMALWLTLVAILGYYAVNHGLGTDSELSGGNDTYVAGNFEAEEAQKEKGEGGNEKASGAEEKEEKEDSEEVSG